MNEDNPKTKHGPIKAVFVLTAFLAISYFISNYIHPTNIPIALPEPNFFLNLKLEAKSVYVFDITTNKKIYSKDPDDILPLASITKIMSIITALDILGEDYIVNISAQALAKENDDGLLENEKWRLKDLAEFSLIVSSNDGMQAIGLEAEKKLSGKSNPSLPNFLNEVQKKTYDAGIFTRVINTTGLDMNDDEGGSYGSAKGSAMMLAEGIRKYPEIFSTTGAKETIFTSFSGFTHTAKNTNKAIGDMPEIIAGKTGLTDLAGGNLVVAIKTNNGNSVLISILGSGENSRFEDIKKLSRAVIKYSNYQASLPSIQD